MAAGVRLLQTASPVAAALARGSSTSWPASDRRHSESEESMTESYVIGVLGGDGIGPEVTAEAINVLRRVGELRSIDFDFRYGLLGGCAYEAHGTPLPGETLTL